MDRKAGADQQIASKVDTGSQDAEEFTLHRSHFVAIIIIAF